MGNEMNVPQTEGTKCYLSSSKNVCKVSNRAFLSGTKDLALSKTDGEDRGILRCKFTS